MNREEALAELSRRQNLNSGQASISTEQAKEEFARRQKLRPKRKATYKEFSRLMPFYGPAGQLPEDAALSPAQSVLLGISGGIGGTGHGLQQIAANLLGSESFAEKNRQAAQAAQAATRRARQDNPLATLGGEVLGGIASSLPIAPIAMPATGTPLFSTLGRAGLEGSLLGGAQFTDDNESRLLNTLIGGGAGALTPLALTGIGKIGKAVGGVTKDITKRLTGLPKASIIEDLIGVEGISPEYQKQLLDTARKRIKAAQEVGLQLTPQEAFGSPQIAQNLATVGRTGKGAGQLESFYQGKETGRYSQENQAVQDFFQSLGVSPKTSFAETGRKVRESAKEIIGEQVKRRQETAEPLYKAASGDKIPKKVMGQLLDDENIAQANAAIRKDPAFRQKAKGITKNSIEYWDLVKKRLDDNIAKAQKNRTKEKLSILMSSKEKLLNELDAISPNYAKARSMFKSESDVLKELTDTNLGKLSTLDDSQLKNISSVLFDPKEIDSKTLNTVRTKLLKQNPGTYYEALAQSMQNKMDTIARSATKRELPAFYKAVLQTDKNYNMYREALKGNPTALKRLEAMKQAFPDLMGDYTPKAKTALEKTGLTNPRDLLKSLGLKLFKGGKYDQTAVEFMTNPRWFEQAENILSKPKSINRDTQFMKLLLNISREASKVPTALAIRANKED